MQSEYVEVRNGAYYVAGSRVSLASIIYEYRDGATLETVRQNFPTLSKEQIHGAIAFYLGHRDEAETYLRSLEEKWDGLERAAKPANPEFQQRIEEARKRLLAREA
jgi:uncharacterized protein (DUF433 family)